MTLTTMVMLPHLAAALRNRRGNSGNSTELHLHLQVSDSTDWTRARGLPFAFRRPNGSPWVPANTELVSS